MTDLMAGNEPAKDSPEFAIKSLLMSMLQLDRGTAVRYITDAKGMDLLFAGAPRQREPSGVMEASVAEMPIVELEPGELRRSRSAASRKASRRRIAKSLSAGLDRSNCRSCSSGLETTGKSNRCRTSR